MARIWMSGIEAGHMDVFTAMLNAAINAVQVRTGAYSLYHEWVSSWSKGVFPASKSEIYGRFAVRPAYTSSDTNGNILLTLRDNAGTTQITIQLNQYTGQVQVRRGAYNSTVIGRGGELHQDRWNCIEFRLLVDDAPGGVFQLKVDGTQVIDFAGDTQETANANVLSFEIGGVDGVLGNACIGYYDDIAFNDVAGGVNDSWIGRGGIPAIFPEGVGNSTDLQLHPNTGEANWEDVDEKPPDDDTTYVFDDLVDDHDSYETEDLIATGTISAVQWLARAKAVLVGAPEIMRVLRIGGTDYDGAADIAIDAAYDYYTEILDLDPDAGPGVWTVAAVNGMELGVKIR